MSKSYMFEFTTKHLIELTQRFNAPKELNREPDEESVVMDLVRAKLLRIANSRKEFVDKEIKITEKGKTVINKILLNLN